MVELGNYGEDQFEEELNLQKLINSGMAWKWEGGVGREAMTALEDGRCMLPNVERWDYWGNVVPARYMLEPGSVGTRELVVERYGEEYAKELEEQE